jgi:hypothetical protein
VYPVVGVVGFPRLKDHVLEVLDHPNDLFILLADKYKTFTVPGGMMDCDPRHFRVGFGATVRARPGWLSALSVSHSKSFFVWRFCMGAQAA